MNKIAAEAEEAYLTKNASNQSGGSIEFSESNILGCGTNGLYPYPTTTSTSKKTIRTTTTVREYNDEGKLVKETETIIEEETNPSFTQPFVSF